MIAQTDQTTKKPLKKINLNFNSNLKFKPISKRMNLYKFTRESKRGFWRHTYISFLSSLFFFANESTMFLIWLANCSWATDTFSANSATATHNDQAEAGIRVLLNQTA